MMQTHPRPPRLAAVAVVALLASVIGAGGVALASHQFDDVGDSNPFHDQISAIADAGITTGFDDGGYHPNDGVSRQAMAAFMARGFGRAGFDEDVDTSPSNGAAFNGAFTAIAPGAADDSGGSGYVVVNATATLTVPVGECPCTISAVARDATFADEAGVPSTSMSDGVSVAGDNQQSVAVTGRFPLPEGAAHSFTIRITVLVDGVTTAARVDSNLTATYVPFDETGNGA
jgi:hypothetical protein